MAVSVAMLGLAELPVAIFLILIARRAREYENDRSGYPAGLPDASLGLQAGRAEAENPSSSIRSSASRQQSPGG